MGTVSFPCGCHMSSAMFGNQPILSVYACIEHAEVFEVQTLFEQLSLALRKTIEEKQ